MNIKNILKKIISGKWFPLYHSFFAKSGIKNDRIFLESRGGLSVEGNILRILMELQKDSYRQFHKVLTYKKGCKEIIQKRLAIYGIHDVELVRYASVKYYFDISVAKYLVNDTTFPGRFIKKEGQMLCIPLWSTWRDLNPRPFD